MKDTEINKLIELLSVADLSKLIEKYSNKPTLPAVYHPRSTRIIVEKEIIHEYHCEMCASIKKHSFSVKCNVSSQASLDLHYNKPIILHTVCDNCKKAIILGIALAINLVKRSNKYEG